MMELQLLVGVPSMFAALRLSGSPAHYHWTTQHISEAKLSQTFITTMWMKSKKFINI